MIIRLDTKTCSEEIFNVIANNPEYKEATLAYREALESANLDKESCRKIEDTALHVETVTAEIAYKKAFRDGMCFVMNALAGKEVIEI